MYRCYKLVYHTIFCPNDKYIVIFLQYSEILCSPPNAISSVMCFAYMKAISKCEYSFIVV